MPDASHALEETVTRDVTRALAEDVGAGDLTAALIPADRTSHARLLTRQSGVLCGVEWFSRTTRVDNRAVVAPRRESIVAFVRR